MMTINARTLYLGRLERSPLGPLWAAVTANGLAAVEWDMSVEQFTHQLLRRFPGASIQMDAGQTADALRQLSEYLAGKHRAFDLPIDWSGMGEFQVRALKQTAAIPYGSTSTYAEIARQIGHPGAARAVGRAEATNPMPIVLPCHRVLGTDGKLHGYGGPGGIQMKRWLLELEGFFVPRQ